MEKMKKVTPIIVVAILVLGSLLGCKPYDVPAKSTGSRLGSTGMAEGVTTEALIQALQQNGFEVVEGETFEQIVPVDTPSRGDYAGLVALTDTTAKRPNEFVVGVGPEGVIWFESHDISGDDAIKDWEAHIEKRIHLVEDKSQEAFSQSDDIDTQKALANILPSEANLPEGVRIKLLPEGKDLPYGINANPYISDDQTFIDTISKDMFPVQFPFPKGEITSALFVVYDSKKEMGIYGFEFDTKKNAEQAYLITQQNMNRRLGGDRISLLQTDKLILMVWTDEDIQNKNYQAFLKLIKAANKSQ